MRNRLQWFLLCRDRKYELLKWIIDMAGKRKIKIVWLSEEERKRIGVDGYAYINTLGIPRECPLEEIIPILGHEIGHWSQNRRRPGMVGVYAATARHGLYPVIGTEESVTFRDNEADEFRAWDFSRRLIEFYYRRKK